MTRLSDKVGDSEISVVMNWATKIDALPFILSSWTKKFVYWQPPAKINAFRQSCRCRNANYPAVALPLFKTTLCSPQSYNY
jgi:hypothetical protein